MLEIVNVERVSDRHTVLSAVSLAVQSREFVSILGPTGSGKTSLLRAIMGFDLIDGGEVRFDGRLLAKPGVNLVAPEQRGFSLVFEKTTLLPFLNVEQNILIGSQPGDKTAGQRLQEILDLVGLNRLRNRSSHTLSAGEQQRVALARSLFVQPRLLLLDEPFRNLDRPWRESFIPILKGFLERQGAAAILVTHDRDEAFSLSRRIFLMNAGRICGGDAPERLYRHPTGDWDARLLGECNILPVETAREFLQVQPCAADTRWIAVRPEDIEVDAEPPHNATLREKTFFGFYTTIVFTIKEDMPVTVKTRSAEDLVLGGHYRLRLARREHAHEFASLSDAPQGETP